MTAKTWNGTTSQFTDGTGWTPAGAPQPGDTATISSGTVFASALNLQGLGIAVTANSSADGSFVLLDSTLAADTTLAASNPNRYGTGATPVVKIQGTTTNLGTISLTGSVIQLPFSDDSGSGPGTLINRGNINIIDASPQVQAASGASTPTIENDGTITVTHPGTAFQSPVVSANITGAGTISLGANAGIDLRQAVGSGQTIAFSGGVNGGAILQLEQPANFNPTISGFVSGNTITISNTPYDSSSYNSQTGILSLSYLGTPEGQLHFAGVYNQGNFSLVYTPLGGGFSNLQITTNVINSATGATSGSGGSGSGGSGSVGATYRFFDTRFGTHFFTSDVNEKNVVLNTRPDLKEETNGFGDVQQSDPNAVPVYRFFDTNYGTHFFTSNVSERDGLIANRKDLTYEANSTFYEHGTQQSGDVAVYRLFDTRYGTQFLTGDQGEYNGITTPGTSAYRSDLRSEGVAFYAPAGTFT